jgi:hypothetical protein
MEPFFLVLLGLCVAPIRAVRLYPSLDTCCGRCYTALTADFPNRFGRAYQDSNANDVTTTTNMCISTLACGSVSLTCGVGLQSIDCLNLRWAMNSRCQPVQSECFLAMREEYRVLFGNYPNPLGRDQDTIALTCGMCYNNVDTCPLGQEKKECKNLRWYSRDFCQACAANTYRDNIANQIKCVTCRPCHSTEIETAPCSTISNRQCACQNAETYKAYQIDFKMSSDPALTFCPTCTVCRAPTHRMKSDCGFANDRVCEACDEGSRSTLNNNLCNACQDGYLAVNGVCRPCTANNAGCIRDQYINCVGGVRTCPVCDGHIIAGGGTPCASGRGVAGRCDGSSLVNPACQDCGPGLERPDGTPLVEGVYQACVKCGTGKYKGAVGTGNCVDCTNKPANSAYVGWGINEVASTSNCPW